MKRLSQNAPKGWPLGLERRYVSDHSQEKSLDTRLRAREFTHGDLKFVFSPSSDVRKYFNRPPSELALFRALVFQAKSSISLNDVMIINRLAGCSGALRTMDCFTSKFQNGISFQYPDARKAEKLITHVVNYINSIRSNSEENWLAIYSVVFCDVITAHAFSNGNGRCAHVLASRALMQAAGVSIPLWPIGAYLFLNQAELISATLIWLFEYDLEPILSLFEAAFTTTSNWFEMNAGFI